MKESKIEQRIVREAERQGGLALKLAPIGSRGFPDRTILLPGGRIRFVEIKTSDGRPSRQQIRWIEKLKALGFDAEIVKG